MDGIHLLLDLITLENWHAVVIFLNALHMTRHKHFHLGLSGLVGLFTFDKDFIDFTCIKVTNGALDQITFLMDQAWCLRFQRSLANFVP